MEKDIYKIMRERLLTPDPVEIKKDSRFAGFIESLKTFGLAMAFLGVLLCGVLSYFNSLSTTLGQVLFVVFMCGSLVFITADKK